MKKQDYTATIVVSKTPKEVFNSINSVSKWWSENLEGDSENLNGVFTIHFAADVFVTHKLIEVIPNKKVVWLVTDCHLSWLKDKTEWTNTKMSFEIATKDNSTELNFTHIGLVPEVECYNDCVKGWDQYIKDSLFKLITEGKGEPQKKK
jgi:hypothetical protein